jgi:hypothetical protein
MRLARSPEPVSFGTELIDPVEHSLEKRFGGQCRYSGLLERKNFPPLPPDLHAPALDFSSEEVNVRHVPPSPS